MGPQWIEDTRRHLQAAQVVESIDPAGAYVLAYAAARKSVAAVLLMTGHRVTSCALNVLLWVMIAYETIFVYDERRYRLRHGMDIEVPGSQ